MFEVFTASFLLRFYLAGNWHEDIEEETRSRLPNVPKSCNHNSLKTYNDDGDNTSMTDQHGDPLHPASSSCQIFCTTSTNTAIGLAGTQKISQPIRNNNRLIKAALLQFIYDNQVKLKFCGYHTDTHCFQPVLCYIYSVMFCTKMLERGEKLLLKF